MESYDPLTAETSMTTPGATPSPKADGYGMETATQGNCEEKEEQAEFDWENEEEGRIFKDDWFTPIQPNPERSWRILTATEKAAPRPGYKEIRLLRIAPGLFDDPLSCTRITTALSDANFEAVSYTWADETGNGEYSEVLTCDGIESRVTRNGASLLRHVRLRDRARIIWMDQLCINQSDNYEKSWQVQLMPDIYEKAEEVLIFAAPEIIFPEYLLDADVYPKDDEFLNIMQLRWSSRVWVLQEVTRATRVSVLAVMERFRRLVTKEKVFITNAGKDAAVGQVFEEPVEEILITSIEELPRLVEWMPRTRISYVQKTWESTFQYRQSIPWEEFRSKILGWHQKLSSNIKAKANLPGALNLQMQKGVPYNGLHGLLQLTRSTCSGDPRDKVFALFGIVISAAKHGLVADYTKTTELVFAETAWHIVSTTNTLEILSSRHEGTSNFQVASWVPDWTKPSPRSLRSDLRNRSLWDGAHLTDHQQRFHHALLFRDLAPSFRCDCGKGELQLKGHFLDMIKSINENSLGGNAAKFSNEGPMTMPLSLETSTDCSLNLSYWDQWARMSDRSFFLTKHSTGFSQSKTEVGDEVWHLHGADILFVLRKHNDVYKLVTECFLWGVSYHTCCWEDNCE